MVNSIKGKTIIPMVGVLVILIGFIFVYVSSRITGLADNLTQERILTASQAARAYMLQLEESNLMSARAISGSPELQTFVQNWNNNINRAETRLELLQYLNASKDYFGVTSFVVTDQNGNVILRTHAILVYGDSGLVSPGIALALQEGISSMVYSSTAAMAMGLSGAAPIQDATGIIGTISTIVDVATEEFLDQFASIFNAEVTLFAGTERVATTVVDPATGRRPIGTHIDRDVAAVVLEQGQILDTAVTLFGVPFQGSYFPLTGWGGTPVGMFFIGFSLQHTIDQTYELQRGLVIIGLIALAITITGMLLYLIRMLKPLDLLKSNLNDIANGDADLTKRLPITGKDEIAEASSFFNQIMEQFKTMLSTIKKQAGTLSAMGNDLASNMTETASSMNQIAANIQNIKTRIMSQSTSVSQTNSTMAQVTGNINKLSDHVDQQTSSVSQSAAAIEEMLANIQSVTSILLKNAKNVKDLQESAEDGKNSLQEVSADIKEIARESEGLLEINTVMENIAGMTNLLSMNAAIEAARAGESGRGFAVVAGEIRKLAENSSNQSNTIAAVLKKIKDSIDKITRSTDRVMEKFQSMDNGVKIVADQEETIRNAMEEQSKGSKQVLQVSSRVNEITQQVKGGSLEMLEGSKEVIKESRNLEQVTQEIAIGMNEMASGAEQVNVAVNHVNEISTKTREGISSLLREVSRFKVE